ncbi:arsenate reductase (glutaredoxin) [Pedobacter boryungensis]|uniref:Arsenate reductase (Glutaredoxin) n=1 Tax=Pedobacter boryungensis TaxID=869962 RepID=A0ABX2D895_9SPHI|nr:arsenate reductase (glutaredoxin) [Pedobacter boryungensis]NQX30272.1 arsenate reductase (glutaredoxin) [Pedobacter boryungensis]
MLIIYHNNSCSKSREALKALTKSDEEFQIVNYLEDIPSVVELKNILQKLGCKPHDLIRTNEKVYLEKYKGKELTDEEWIIAMHENPILIQRPIVVNGDRAVIARTDDALDEIL